MFYTLQQNFYHDLPEYFVYITTRHFKLSYRLTRALVRPPCLYPACACSMCWKAHHLQQAINVFDAHIMSADESKDKQRSMEDELRDPKYFLEYLLPRPVRLAFLGA